MCKNVRKTHSQIAAVGPGSEAAAPSLSLALSVAGQRTKCCPADGDGDTGSINS